VISFGSSVLVCPCPVRVHTRQCLTAQALVCFSSGSRRTGNGDFPAKSRRRADFRIFRADIPKLDPSRPETKFDQECVSSIPLTSATHSLDLRLWSVYTQNSCNLRRFSHLEPVSESPKIRNFAENLSKVSNPNRRNSRF
jgi:hypothetical protein